MDKPRGSRKVIEHTVVAMHGTAGIAYWALALVPAWDVANVICLVGLGIALAYCWQNAIQAYRARPVNPPPRIQTARPNQTEPTPRVRSFGIYSDSQQNSGAASLY